MLWISLIILPLISSILADITLKLLCKVLRIMTIAIMSKKSHPAIIATFSCLQRKYIFKNISNIGLLYLFGLWLQE